MASGKTALLLGAGLVVGPLVEHLTAHGVRLIIASRRLEPAQQLVDAKAAKGSGSKAVRLDVTADADTALLEQLIQECDVVLSLVPWTNHGRLAKLAVKHGKHFCTASYVSDAMRELDAEAKSKDLILFNECGVDPGLDHMSAKRVIDEVHAKGGKILSFTSFCGGLPAPEANNNPFGYKLSWSPRGVLLASGNSATFLKDGKRLTIPGLELFASPETFHVPGTDVVFEGYPNRDSTIYTGVYGIEEAQTCIRGTLRNQGWCKTLKKMADLGFLSLDKCSFDADTSYAAMTLAAAKVDPDAKDVRAAVAQAVDLSPKDDVLDRLEWLGLFDKERMVSQKHDTVLDAICELMTEKMQYGPDERDWLVMHHTFGIEYADGKKETRTSTMLDYGTKTDTSMARTVSLPLAIAVVMLLEDKITQRGIVTPVIPEIYNPILDGVDALGIKFSEVVA